MRVNLERSRQSFEALPQRISGARFIWPKKYSPAVSCHVTSAFLDGELFISFNDLPVVDNLVSWPV